MEAMETVLSRRSIRKYTATHIPQYMVMESVEGWMSAPSSHKPSPWHFVLVDDRTILNRIPESHPYSKMLYEAPLAIIVCGHRLGQRWWVQDCSAAVEGAS